MKCGGSGQLDSSRTTAMHCAAACLTTNLSRLCRRPADPLQGWVWVVPGPSPVLSLSISDNLLSQRYKRRVPATQNQGAIDR